MRPTIWLVGGGVESLPGIERAQALGMRVIVSDGSPGAPGLARADHGVVVSTYDAAGTLEAARSVQRKLGAIDGISSVATDVPVTVATVAAGLGLPGIAVESAHLSMDKLAMKEALRRAGVPVPDFAAVETAAEVRGFAASRERVVLKPVDSRGARGVHVLGPGSDVEAAVAHARAESPSGRMIVEAFVPGPQFSTEGLWLAGEAFPVAVNDRNYDALERFAPYVIEDGGSFPPRLSTDQEESLGRLALAAGRALGVEDGVVKGDLVWSPEGPKVIEVALRLSGGFFCTHQIPLATGVDLVGCVLRRAVGAPLDPVELVPMRRRGVAIRYAFPPAGRVRAVADLGALRATPGIEIARHFVARGDTVGDPRNHTQRAGCVLATGTDAAAAIRLAEWGVERLGIEVEPAEGVVSGFAPTPPPA